MKKILFGIIILFVYSTIKQIIIYCNFKKYNDDVNLLTASLYGKSITFPTVIDLMNKSFNVYINSSAIFINSARFALVTSTGLVFCSSEYMNMSEMAKRFIIEHENGHIINKHELPKHYWVKRKFAVMCGKVLPIELEADEYAASVIGKEAAIIGLKEMYSHISFIDLVNKLELRSRIRNISNS